MSDEQITKFMDDPQHSWWTEPMTLILGKAAIATGITEPVFPNIEAATKGRHQVRQSRIISDGQSSLSALVDG